jgi:hypothetical protein
LADGGGHGGGGDLRALHDRLLRDRDLQFDFAVVEPPKPIHWPPWLHALGRWIDHVFGGALPLLKWVFWIGVGAAVLLVVWLILREVVGARWARRRRAVAPRGAPTDWAPDPRRARALLENADRLAAQGRFDLAVRLILHRGIEDIEQKRPRLVRPALTARDIAGLEALPASARAAFATMAAIVEFSAFGGQPIGESAFGRCRAAYEAFAFPDVWR